MNGRWRLVPFCDLLPWSCPWEALGWTWFAMRGTWSHCTGVQQKRKERGGRHMHAVEGTPEMEWRALEGKCIITNRVNCLSTVWKGLLCSWHYLWHLTFVLLWAPHSQLFLSSENADCTEEVASDQMRGAKLKEEGKVYTSKNNDVGVLSGSEIRG